MVKAGYSFRMDFFERLWPYLSNIWSAQIVVVDNNAITIGTLSVGILLFVFGYWAAKLTSRKLSSRILKRFELEASIRATIESLSFYLLFILFTFMSMKMANFPLSIFSVLGGAFAIGIGFGSQNVINNFISGLILLFERPVKVRDFVEVEDVYGVVERIGFRSTNIRSFGNKHIIVPNSALLEKKLINWTHFDKFARVKVVVGVAYGSPTRKVEELLLQAVQEEEKTIKSRAPLVLFSDFADSALTFEVYFWIQLHELMDQHIIKSNMRYRINELFAKEGIVIAFPQQDLHIAHPIRVELTH